MATTPSTTSVICEACNIWIHQNSAEAHFKGKKHLSKQREFDRRYCTVYVSGVYNCTMPILMEKFSVFGKVEEISDTFNKRNFCFVRFSNKESAQKALKAKIYHNWKRLTVREVKTFDNSVNSKDAIPSSVNLEDISYENTDEDEKNSTKSSSDKNISAFDAQIQHLILQIECPQNSEVLKQICSDIEYIYNPILPGVKAIIFGSSLTGLCMKNSDVDIFMECVQYKPEEDFVNRKAKIIYKSKLVTNVFLIRQARVPLVKCIHRSTNIPCDIIFKSKLGVHNSCLIKFYIELDERIKPLLMTIKHWAKVYGITGDGHFSNYAIVMMTLFYLQQLDPPVIPSVSKLQENVAEDNVDGWNCNFNNDHQFWKANNKRSVKDLLTGFFKYYSEYDYNNVICPLLGKSVPVSSIEDPDSLPEELHLYKTILKIIDTSEFKKSIKIRVQDPFELSHNLCRGLNDNMCNRFMTATTVSWKICCESEETILLKNLFTIDETSPLSDRENHSFVIGWQFQGLETQIAPSYQNNSDVTNWFLLVKDSLLALFKDVLKLHVEFNNDDNLEHEKNNSKAFEILKVMCSGNFTFWNLRKKYLKMANLYRHLDPYEQEVFVSNELLKAKSKSNELSSLKFKAVFLPQLPSNNPPEVKLSIVDYGPTKNNYFKQFALFFAMNFEKFVKCSLAHFYKLTTNKSDDNNCSNVEATSSKDVEVNQEATSSKDVEVNQEQTNEVRSVDTPSMQSSAIEEPLSSPNTLYTVQINPLLQAINKVCYSPLIKTCGSKDSVRSNSDRKLEQNAEIASNSQTIELKEEINKETEFVSNQVMKTEQEISNDIKLMNALVIKNISNKDEHVNDETGTTSSDYNESQGCIKEDVVIGNLIKPMPTGQENPTVCSVEKPNNKLCLQYSSKPYRNNDNIKHANISNNKSSNKKILGTNSINQNRTEKNRKRRFRKKSNSVQSSDTELVECKRANNLQNENVTLQNTVKNLFGEGQCSDSYYSYDHSKFNPFIKAVAKIQSDIKNNKS